MKKLILPALLLAVGLAPEISQAQLFHGARPVGHKTFAFGGFGSFVFAPAAEFMAVGTAEFGIGSRFQLEARLGVGTLPIYGAFFMQYQFLASNIVDVGLWGGYHYQGAHHLSLAIPVSHTFRRVEVYGAPLLQAAFSDLGSRYGIGFIAGMDVILAKQLRLFLEFTLGISPILNSGSLGAKFYL